ncbi:hypothetical protein [Thiovibrio frasassiensis]|uniref:Uncharacterized protein n=1 Tax=Thiovibrio frasassiensis TaxID=2984131 RepID=A0A9X4MIM8_9BACT|nr:hypothetical protein [Thiovibrio frasassiensis]MDG4477056.1 hypothetical protein [Thiovibrio frasassiensis]
MKMTPFVLLLVMLLGLLAACTSSQAPEEAKTEKITVPAAGNDTPQPPPVPAESETTPPPPRFKPHEEYAMKVPAETVMPPPASAPKSATSTAGMTVGGDATTAEQPVPPETPPAAKNGGAESGWSERCKDYLASFKDAAYTFNTPSPIKVAKPYPVYLWVDTTASHQALAQELAQQLNTLLPADANRIASGTIQVSPVMKATLKGEKFTITPISPEQQIIHLAGRTTWSWEITPTWPGTHILHLQLLAIPPEGIAADPYTIPEPLDRSIEVKVTLWWLIDSFFDKYWKWLLGGLGTLLLTVLGWWWNKRTGEKS